MPFINEFKENDALYFGKRSQLPDEFVSFFVSVFELGKI